MTARAPAEAWLEMWVLLLERVQRNRAGAQWDTTVIGALYLQTDALAVHHPLPRELRRAVSVARRR